MRLLRIFKKKPKPPLREAMGLVSQATEIAYRYSETSITCRPCKKYGI